MRSFLAIILATTCISVRADWPNELRLTLANYALVRNGHERNQTRPDAPRSLRLLTNYTYTHARHARTLPVATRTLRVRTASAIRCWFPQPDIGPSARRTTPTRRSPLDSPSPPDPAHEPRVGAIGASQHSDASEASLGHQLGARTGLGRSAHRSLCSYTGPPGKHQRGARTKLGRSAHRSSHGETQCI